MQQAIVIKTVKALKGTVGAGPSCGPAKGGKLHTGAMRRCQQMYQHQDKSYK